MSSPGHIVITGAVVLANARPVDPLKGNRNVAFDVNFPVKDGKKRTLGLLRYFTPDERVNELQKVWEKDFTEAFIVARITATPQSGVPSHLIAEDDTSDYAFIGDIGEIILTEGTNIHRFPYIMANGTVTSTDTANLTFSMTPAQYINITRTVLNFPISCFINAGSKKWKNKKPLPVSGSTVSIDGFLTKVKRDNDSNATFEVELDNIAYIGRQSAVSSQSTASSSSSTSLSRNRFDYDGASPTSYSSAPSVPIKRKASETETENTSEDERSTKRVHSDENKGN